MVKPWLKRDLGFSEDTPDEIVEKEWLRRTRHVCKPCWELKYCPYGPLVEQFPHYRTRKEMTEYIRDLKKELKTGEYDKRVRGVIESSRTADEKEKIQRIEKSVSVGISSGKISKKTGEKIKSIVSGMTDNFMQQMREQAEKEIEAFNPKDYPEKTDYRQKCLMFGHYCPVFFANEPFTETRAMRRISRDIPRATLLRVIRRDNQTCQVCGKNLMENEIEIDHIIPYALGGSTEESNLRVLCHDCNRKKGNAPGI